MNYCDASAHCFSPLGSDGSNKIAAEWNAPMHSTEMIPTAKWTSSCGSCVGVVWMHFKSFAAAPAPWSSNDAINMRQTATANEDCCSGFMAGAHEN